MSMKEDLMGIRGIGEAKADEIMTVFEDYQTEKPPEEYIDDVESAMDYIQDGRPGYAMKFLRRVVDE